MSWLYTAHVLILIIKICISEPITEIREEKLGLLPS